MSTMHHRLGSWFCLWHRRQTAWKPSGQLQHVPYMPLIGTLLGRQRKRAGGGVRVGSGQPPDHVREGGKGRKDVQLCSKCNKQWTESEQSVLLVALSFKLHISHLANGSWLTQCGKCVLGVAGSTETGTVSICSTTSTKGATRFHTQIFFNP